MAVRQKASRSLAKEPAYEFGISKLAGKIGIGKLTGGEKKPIAQITGNFGMCRAEEPQFHVRGGREKRQSISYA
ncbi:MAG: hypothetical protein IJC48_09760 [Clostridia bacterium]|nr:hypothetical protein [Clostridia bacterium]MBQ4157490.1 hypothetical protein [Clostridia bacterium]